jgi:hypothetical protein
MNSSIQAINRSTIPMKPQGIESSDALAN